MEGDVSHSHPMFRRVLLPKAAAVFIACDIERPRQLLLALPMLTHHGDESRGRALQTGQGEAVVTRDRGMLVGHAPGFHGQHRQEAWPLLQRRQGLQVRHDLDASGYAPSMGVVELVKALVCMTPWEVGFALLLHVRLDSCR